MPTRHTHKWDRLHTRHLLLEREYTHTHRRTNRHRNDTTTNTQLGPTKYGADSHRGGALSHARFPNRKVRMLYVRLHTSHGTSLPIRRARKEVNWRPNMLFADDDDAWTTELSEDSRDHRRAEEERRAKAQLQQQREKAAANKAAPAPNPLHILRSPIRGSGSSPASTSTLRRRGEPAKASTATAPAPAPAKPMTSLFKQLNWSLENARRRNSGRSMPASARCPEADARPDQAAARGARLAHGAPGTSLCLLCCRSR